MQIRYLNKIILILIFCLSTFAYSRQYRVAISQIVEHPSLNEIRKGLTEGLYQKEGFSQDSLSIEYLNAHGNMVTSAQIASRFIGSHPDLVVGISTPSAQHLAAKKSLIPVVFTGVTDPLSARLVSSLEKPGAQISGVMLSTPVREHLRLILRTKPGARNIAFLFNGGEANSVHVADIFRVESKAAGLTPLITSINQSSQIAAAIQSLISKQADALYLPTDNTVISSLGTILQICQQHHLPVFASDLASGESGALAAMGPDHYEIGLLTARMVAQILRGAKAGDLPVAAVEKNRLYLNFRLASDKMGLSFPVSVLKEADKIIR
ncbi:MAG: ABC transporter substrate-binding protein [Deltaproteobacteria bacterium]|nr:ABC transporter substrate-binding protein [Deltaproteobacteria bacterium]